MPFHRPLALGAATAVVGASMLIAPSASLAAQPLDELALTVVGDGIATGNTTVPVTVRLVDGAGSQTGEVALPTTADGAQQPFTLSADRDQQGALQQSADHSVVTLGGYAAAPGVTSVNDTEAPATLRVIAQVGADGSTDTSTTLSGAYSKRHIRGVAAIDGSRYWTGGHGHDSVGAVRAGVLTVQAGGSAPNAVVSGGSALNNTRVVDVHDGQLYATSDRDGYSGLNAVGTGTPTSAAAMTLVAPAPAGAQVAHDFAFAGDYLYVGYTEGASGIAKYRNTSGTWTYVDSFEGTFWGLEGRAAGDDVVLYAVEGSAQGNDLVRIVDSGDDTAFAAEADLLTTAAPGTAFRGVAFAPGFTPGDQPVDSLEPTPALVWDRRISGASGGALAAVLGGGSSPVASGTVTDPLGEAVTLAASSSDQQVVPDSGIDVQVEDGRFTLSATPAAAGVASIAVTATTADGRTSTTQLAYRVTDRLDPNLATAHFGMSDASAAIAVGDGYFYAADDDSNAIRLFAPDGGEAVAEFDVDAFVPLIQSGQAHDFEAVAQAGDQVFWIGSTGNSRSGNVRPDRDIIVQTALSGTGADATLTFVGYRHVAQDALVTWDAANGHGLGADALGFAAAIQPGSSAEGPNSLNIEGAAMAPDGTTLWLGFRSPLVGDTQQALIVPIADIAAVIAGADAIVGQPILLDLGGRAIREMARTDDGHYLIVAGSADDAGRFALYGWTGDPADAPVPARNTLGLTDWAGSYEGVAGIANLSDGTTTRLLLDSGTVDIYRDGTEAQDLAAVEHKLFASQVVTLDFAARFTAKSIDLVEPLRVGGTSTVQLTGFAAGERITIDLNPDSVTLAQATAGADGTATVAVSVPTSIEAGEHTLTATADSGSTSIPVTVLAATQPPVDEQPSTAPEGPTTGIPAHDDELSTTGASIAAPLTAALLLLTLSVAAVTQRRRARLAN